ncbi:MAG TPA: AMP-binding protein [Streptosporangiaceae bacterium]
MRPSARRPGPRARPDAPRAGHAVRTAPFNVNYRYTPAELTRLFADACTAAIIYHQRFAPVLDEALAGLPARPLLIQVADDSMCPPVAGAIDYEDCLAGQGDVLAASGHSPDDLYILYTGGTTGTPKGTLWRQADIFDAALGGDELPGATLSQLADAAAARPALNFVPNAPFMHGAAHWLGLRTLLSGGCVCVNAVVDRLEPADVWTTIQAHKAYVTLLIGEAFARPLLDELQAGSYDVSSLRAIAVGGAFTSPATKQRLLELIPQAIVIDLAGASETGSALRQISGPGSPPLATFTPGPTVAVLDADRTAALSPGHAGIGWLAKSGRIPLGYLGDQAKTARTFPFIGGTRWSVPGDRARLLADGQVELLGRDAQTINSLGEKIFAEEVEQALVAHPAVRDALVVGRPSERWGEEVVAIIELMPETNPADTEILAALARQLARYKLPKAIIRIPEIQRSAAGKADYAWASQLATKPAAASN